MSDRPFLKPSSVVTAGDMSLDVISNPTILNQKTGAGYDFTWTGTPTGVFSVEVSNTYSLNADGSANNAGSWTPITLSAPIIASGSADNAFVNLAGLEAYAVRLVYTATSGAGTLNAVICGKVQ